MSDLFSSLRDPEQLPTPDPSAIRGRGDALRRRRQALQAGGVAALVAVVALGAVGLSGGLRDSSSPDLPPATRPVDPTPTSPSPSADSSSQPLLPVTTIPADLDLVRDWLDDDGAGTEVELAAGPEVQWLSDVVECDASHSPRDESVDHLGVRYSMVENLQARDLRVFKDVATARRVAEDYASWFRDCPAFSIDGGTSETRNAVSPLRLGDQSWLVSQTYWMDDQPQLAESALVVVRVANTVLVTQRYGEYPGATDPAATEQMHADYLDELGPIVADVECSFAERC